jgi:integrase/recombinase XerD
VKGCRDGLLHLENIHMAPTTVERFAKHVAALGLFLSARAKTFEQITIRDYDQFIAWLTHQRNALPSSPNLIPLRSAETRPPLSVSLRNQIHMAVKSFYRNLVNNERFEIEVHERRRGAYGNVAYKPFLEHISARGYLRRKDVYNTGLRIGEALGLRHVDIDVSDKVIWVVPRMETTRTARAKSGRVRGVPVHEYVINMYEDLLTSAEYADAFESGASFIFCNVTRGQVGKAMAMHRAKKLQRQLAARTALEFHWHMLRHSQASEAIAAGYSLIEIADRLGHTSPQTTVSFYRHLLSAEIRKLYLTGPYRVQERLSELRDADILSKDIRWL